MGVLIRYRSTILAGPVALAAMAVAAFAIALGADIAMDQNFYLEDGFKFVGLWTWAAYLVAFSRQTILREAEVESRDASPSEDDANRSSSDGVG